MPNLENVPPCSLAINKMQSLEQLRMRERRNHKASRKCQESIVRVVYYQLIKRFVNARVGSTS